MGCFGSKEVDEQELKREKRRNAARNKHQPAKLDIKPMKPKNEFDDLAQSKAAKVQEKYYQAEKSRQKDGYYKKTTASYDPSDPNSKPKDGTKPVTASSPPAAASSPPAAASSPPAAAAVASEPETGSKEEVEKPTPVSPRTDTRPVLVGESDLDIVGYGGPAWTTSDGKSQYYDSWTKKAAKELGFDISEGTDLLTIEKPVSRYGGNNESKVNALIVCGVQGNQPAGFVALNQLIDLGYFKGWVEAQSELNDLSITLIIANPLALSIADRFISTNLDTVLREDLLTHDPTDNGDPPHPNYEYKRGAAVLAEIQSADHILVLQSSSYNSPPWLAPAATPTSTKLAQQVSGFPFVVQDLIHKTDRAGSIADASYANAEAELLTTSSSCITAFAGLHTQLTTLERSRQLIHDWATALSKHSSIASPPSPAGLEVISPSSKPTVLRITGLEQVRNGFEWKNDSAPEPFSQVPLDTVIASSEEDGDIKAPHSTSYVVLPSTKPLVGEPAFYWASSHSDISDEQVEKELQDFRSQREDFAHNASDEWSTLADILDMVKSALPSHQAMKG